MFDNLDKIFYAVVPASLLWMIRTIFTNNKKMELMEYRMNQKDVEDEKRHSETKNSIEALCTTHEKAMDRQQKILEKILEK
jgi:hypothetical protein